MDEMFLSFVMLMRGGLTGVPQVFEEMLNFYLRAKFYMVAIKMVGQLSKFKPIHKW